MGKYTHMHQVEVALARRWRDEGKSPHAIAHLLQRCPKTIRKQLAGGAMKAKVGRPALPKTLFTKCKAALKSLQVAAKGQKEVTVAMVRKKAGVTCCERAIRDMFKANGMPFRRLREKPLLKPEDVEQRLQFATKHVARAKGSWVTYPHAIIDNKRFPLYLDRQAREYAARRSVRGAYRHGSDAVKSYLVKPKNTLKYPVAGAMVAAGVIKGRIRFWHVIEGRWNATKAVEMYAQLAKVLAKAYPEHACKPRAKWVVLEDNDPSGYKSSAALQKKKDLGINIMTLPRRSPDLNVLDYSLWKEINKRLRAQEASFKPGYKESKASFLARLRRTACGIPAATVKAAVESMRRRCKQIKANAGYLIDE
jgi:hypothetical protein